MWISKKDLNKLEDRLYKLENPMRYEVGDTVLFNTPFFTTKEKGVIVEKHWHTSEFYNIRHLEKRYRVMCNKEIFDVHESRIEKIK